MRGLLTLSITFVTLLACFGASPSFARPTLVVLLGEDATNEKNNASFISLENQAKDLYTKIYGKDGFDFTELSQKNSTLTPEMLAKTLGSIKGSSELQLLIVGHGIANEKKEFHIQSDPPITGVHIKSAIVQAIQNNPRMKVYIPTNSCYSGALAEQLADVPGVLTLAPTGDNRPNSVVIEPTPESATKTLFDELAKGKDYATANQIAWNQQLVRDTSSPGGAIEAVKGMDELPIKETELALLRTQSEAFLQAWCASEEKIGARGDLGFCVRTDVGAPLVQIPSALKEIGAHEVQANSETHLKSLQTAYEKAGCKNQSADPSPDEFQKIKTEQVKLSLNRLASKIDSTSLDDFKKGLVAGLQDNLAQIQAGLLQGVNPEAIRAYIRHADTTTVAEMASYQNHARSMIDGIKRNCFESSGFNSSKPFSDPSGHVSTTCGDAYSYWMADDWKRFYPDDVRNPKGLYSYSINLSGSTTKELFASREKSILDHVHAVVSQRVYFSDVKHLLDTGLETFATYCGFIDGSIKEIQHDLSCLSRFKTSASSADWSRFIDIYALSTRTPSGDGK